MVIKAEEVLLRAFTQKKHSAYIPHFLKNRKKNSNKKERDSPQ
jgi:hypothetical protein